MPRARFIPHHLHHAHTLPQPPRLPQPPSSRVRVDDRKAPVSEREAERLAEKIVAVGGACGVYKRSHPSALC